MPVAADDLGGHSGSENAVFYASHRGTPGEGVNLQKHSRLTRSRRANVGCTAPCAPLEIAAIFKERRGLRSLQSLFESII